MKIIRPIVFLFFATLAMACSSIRQGTVISKHARSGVPDPAAARDQFRYAMPEVCWVCVEGLDKHGRKARRNVILFRNDWKKIRVGDHWCAGGPRLAENSGK